MMPYKTVSVVLLLIVQLQIAFAWKCVWGLRCFNHYYIEKKEGGGCESHCNDGCIAIAFDIVEQLCIYFNSSWNGCKCDFEKMKDGNFRWWSCLKHLALLEAEYDLIKFSDCGHPEISPDLTNGTSYTKLNSWPWHVRIEDAASNKTFSGILISNTHVLTKNDLMLSPIKSRVILGVDDFNNPLSNFVNASVVHSRHSTDSKLLVLTLDRFVENARNIHPICVNPLWVLEPTDTCYLVTFHGQQLFQTQMQLADKKKCDEIPGERDESKEFCVWSTVNHFYPSYANLDAPLYCFKDNKWQLYGVAKRKMQTVKTNVPASFYRITQSDSDYRDFLISAIYDEVGVPTKRPESATNVLPTTKVIGQKCGDPEHVPERDPRDATPVMRIASGSEAIPNSWPWQVAIFKDNGNGSFDYKCGGTLIGPSHVITAAHCILYSSNTADYKVALGAHNINAKNEPRLEVKVLNFTIADGNNIKKKDFPRDIALLTLEVKITFSEAISPACLPRKARSLTIGQLCYVVGWGRKRSNEKQSPLLQQGGIDEQNFIKVMKCVLIRSDCQEIYKTKYDKHLMLCAGDRHIDTCQGDSGGPLMCEFDDQWYVYGITSFGMDNCGNGTSAVYVKVSSYEEWISKLIM